MTSCHLLPDSSTSSTSGGGSGSNEGYVEDDSDSSILVKDQDVRRAIDILTKFITPARMDKLEAVLSNRTQHAAFVFENPANPNNVWACIRYVAS